MVKAAKALQSKAATRKAETQTPHPLSGGRYISGKGFKGPGADYEWHIHGNSPLEANCTVAVLCRSGDDWTCLGIGRLASQKFPDVKTFRVKFDECRRGDSDGLWCEIEAYHPETGTFYDNSFAVVRCVRKIRDLT